MARDDLLISTNEREFILRALRENELRVDGRGPLDVRRVSYRFGPKDGQCEVTLGQTRVLAVVSASLEAPKGGRANEGRLTMNVEFGPMASPNFEPGRPGQDASEVAVILERAFTETGAVDVESLCVLAGKFVWNVRCDVHVLDACGNIVGASSLAVAGALRSFRRPEATVAPATRQVVVHSPDQREPIPLAIRHTPVAVTFGFFEGLDGVLLIDPSIKEKQVVDGEMVVVMTNHDELCAVHKGGGVGVAPGEVMRCVRLASRVSVDAVSELTKAHLAWETTRDARRVRRHYGASVAVNEKTNKDFGLPGRKDHLSTAATTTAEGMPPDAAQSDSEEDFAVAEEGVGELQEPVDQKQAPHVPLGMMAPNDSESDSDSAGSLRGADISRVSVKQKRPGLKQKNVETENDDDVLGGFDDAARRENGKKTKRNATWDDLPGDGNDLAAAIKSKVDKKKKTKAAKGQK